MTEKLTPSQVRTFVRDGYLIVRGVLDPKLVRQARDLLWEYAQDVPRLQRGDPSSWLEPFSADEQSPADQVCRTSPPPLIPS